MTSGIDRVREIFLLVHELEQAEQEEHVQQLCGDDKPLLAEVQSLLASQQAAPPLLDQLMTTSAQARLEPDAVVAESIGPYRVKRVLGRGSSGIVYQALQETTGRTVAVKLMLPGSIGSDRLARFHREVRVLARLDHPGIARILEAGLVPGGLAGQPYFAMEYVPGEPLTKYASDEKLGTSAICSLTADICDAADYAHEQGVIHRDLKPANILVAGTGAECRARILDFGIAHSSDVGVEATLRTQTGQVVGTLPYASPEQIAGAGKSIDRRTDVYALGAILYELLAKRPALQLAGLSLKDVVHAICHEEPERLDRADARYRGDLEAVVGKALAKDRADRYDSAKELAADLRRFVRGEPVRARVPSAPERARRWAGRNRTFVLASTALFVLLLAGIAATSTLAVRAAGNAARADREARTSAQVAYAASVKAAAAVLRLDPLAAEEHLLRAPAEHRGWEWSYLMQQVVTPAPSFALKPHADRSTIGFTDAGLPLCVLCADGSTRVIDVTSGVTLSEFATGLAPVRPTLSGDGRRLAILEHVEPNEDSEAFVCVYDVLSGERLQTIELPQPVLPYFALSPDGQRLALSNVGGRRAVVDVETGQVRLHGQAVAGRPSFRSDGAVACFGTDLVDLATLELLDAYKIPAAAWYRMSPLGTYLVGIKWRRRPVVLRTTSNLGAAGEPRFLTGLRDYAITVAFSGDETQLAAVGKHGSILVWDLESDDLIRTIPTNAWDVEFAPDARQLLGIGPDGPMLWDLSEKGSMVLRGAGSYVYTVAWNSDGSHIASGDFEGEVRLWDASTTADLGQLAHLGLPVRKLWFTPDDDRVVFSANVPRVWSSASVQALDRSDDQPSSEQLHSRSGNSATEDWDAATAGVHVLARAGIHVEMSGQEFELPFEPQAEAQVRESARAAQARASLALMHSYENPVLALDPTGTWLAIGCADGRLEIWSLTERTKLATMFGHFGPIYCLDVSPDGKRIASAGSDATVRLWDSDSHQELVVLHGHKDYVHAVAFSPDGSKLLSGSGDKTLRIWSSE